jgi:hypothetical protein
MCIDELNVILCACLKIYLIMPEYHACFKTCVLRQAWLLHVLDELRIIL